MKFTKIMLASSALILIFASVASAAYFYDQIVNDPGQISGNNSQDIQTAQDYYVVPYAATTDRFFRITLGGGANNNTNYSILLDNKNNNGGTYQGISGIDYYFVSKGNTTSTSVYKWNGSTFAESFDFAPILTKTNGNKTLTWEVNSNLGPYFSWWATASKYNGNLELYDSTSKVSATPIPAAAWLLGSGLLGLVGIQRRKTSAAICQPVPTRCAHTNL
jgi:hypothetical protein